MSLPPAVAGPWAWQPHPVLWAFLATLGVGVALLHRRLIGATARPAPWPRVRIVRFVGALVVALLALGWPLGDLAAHWSLCALVLQRSVLVLAVAALLLSGLPDDVLAWVTRPAPVDAVLLRVLRPPAAVVTVTVLLVGSMLPPVVAAQSHSAVARALLAVVVTLAGIILWLPVLGRVPGIPRPRPMIRAVYLVAQAIVPVFLSFVFILDPEPLYPAFAHSVDVIRLRPLNDQQVAGFVSKLSFLFVLLSVAGVQLANAPDSDDDLGPEDPLVWADVERHFERIARRGPAITEPVPPVHGSDGPGQSPATGQQGIPPGDADQDHDAGPGPG